MLIKFTGMIKRFGFEKTWSIGRLLEHQNFKEPKIRKSVKRN